MAEVIDVRSSDGLLVVLGSGLTLPNSYADPSETNPPFQGSLRYNQNTQTVQLFITSWNDLSSGGGGGGGLEEVTLTGDATGTTNSGGTISVALVAVATAGTYSNFSIDAKGRVVKARALDTADIDTALGYTPANIVSPAFTGTPTAPTPATTDNSTKIATTAYVQANIFKIVLTTSTTFYVSTTGSNSNSGTISSPFATVSYAYALLVTKYNLNGNAVTIQIENGTYTESVVIAGVPEGFVGTYVSIVGNNTTPADVTFNSTNGPAFSVVNGAAINLSGIKMTSTNSDGLFLQNNSTVNLGNVIFGACPNGFHIQGGGSGSYVTINSPYTISGTAQSHYLIQTGGIIAIFNDASPITLSNGGTLNFSQAFANAQGGNITVIPTVTYTIASGTTVPSVSANATLNGVINTNGQGGANYFPGTAGTSSTGGQYN